MLTRMQIRPILHLDIIIRTINQPPKLPLTLSLRNNRSPITPNLAPTTPPINKIILLKIICNLLKMAQTMDFSVFESVIVSRDFETRDAEPVCCGDGGHWGVEAVEVVAAVAAVAEEHFFVVVAVGADFAELVQKKSFGVNM